MIKMEQQVLVMDENAESQLVHSEAKIERAVKNAYLEVGLELRHIRDNRLYRNHQQTFEEYCPARLDMSDRRARQLIEVASAAEKIGKIFPVLPSRESHVRELLKLEKPEQQAEVWQRVIDTRNGKTVRATDVQAEVERKQAELEKNWITIEEWDMLPEAERIFRLTQVRYSSKTMNKPNDSIEWAMWSWNPVTGCLHDCDYCYARDIANRFYPQKFAPSFVPDRLPAPKNTKVPGARWDGDIGYNGVFVCSMADLFGKWVPEAWITSVLKVIEDNPQWEFLLLTKFPIRMADFEYPPNVWMGTTVDYQWRVERAEKAFRKIKASGFDGICWLSCEPMMERLTFSSLEMFDWLVMGGASKSTQTPEHRPPFDDITHLHNQAREYTLPIYQKTNLIPGMSDRQRLKEYPRR
jgi:protein gp37